MVEDTSYATLEGGLPRRGEGGQRVRRVGRADKECGAREFERRWWGTFGFVREACRTARGGGDVIQGLPRRLEIPPLAPSGAMPSGACPWLTLGWRSPKEAGR
jgi:hypothetical protein